MPSSRVAVTIATTSFVRCAACCPRTTPPTRERARAAQYRASRAHMRAARPIFSPMQSAEIRLRFLDYFRRAGHAVRPSSSLVPGDDPTLLFTNAGMVQFKKVFLGLEDPEFGRRATTSQKCVRAGGKHNDLEQVGHTARHHPFFEILGNSSFGDHFSRDAISFAWEFITAKKWLGIDPQRLMVTVYHTDDEAYELWLKHLPAGGLVPI